MATAASDKALITGLVMLSVCAVLFFATFLREADGQTSARRVEAVFENVTGLTIGNPVRLNGVGIGYVAGMRADNGRARLTLALDRSVSLTHGTRARLRTKTFLGGRFIELKPGPANAAPLPDNSELPTLASPVMPDEIGAQAADLLQGQDGLLRELLTLADWIETCDYDPDRLAQLAGKGRQTLEGLGRIGGHLRKTARALTRLTKTDLTTAASWPERLDTLTTRIRRTHSAIAALQTELATLTPGSLERVDAQLATFAEAIDRSTARERKLLERLERVLAMLLIYDERFVRGLLQQEGLKGGFYPPATGIERLRTLENATDLPGSAEEDTP